MNIIKVIKVAIEYFKYIYANNIEVIIMFRKRSFKQLIQISSFYN